MQAIIGNYAVPILEDRQVWGTSDQTQTAYLDSSGVSLVFELAERLNSRQQHVRVVVPEDAPLRRVQSGPPVAVESGK